MNAKGQVISIEHAIKLNSLGINCPNPSYYWIFDSGMKWDLHPDGYYNLNEEGIEYHIAFTVAELAIMLPHEIRQGPHAPLLFTTIPPNEGTEYLWCTCYIEIGKSILDEAEHTCDGNSQVEAYATLLIHLLENGITTSKQCNSALITP